MQHPVDCWKEFAEIEYRYPDPMSEDLKPNQLFYLIGEAASNSFRLGLVDNVIDEVAIDPVHKLVVLDNGIGLVAAKAGLGSKVLDSKGQTLGGNPRDKWWQLADGFSKMTSGPS